VGFFVLQSLGGLYVEHAIRRASETYGVFALVIGMLSWLWLAAQLLLVAAEVNVVRAERLWPRSLAGDLTPADIRALRRAAESERRDPRQHVSVSFDDPGGPVAT
jgi:membrane protein